MGRRLILLILLILPSTGFAHTWRVDRNGDSDFVVLQDALDAAASGDTISTGPGRYDDWESYGSGGNVRRVCGFVGVGVVTIVGSGAETVIGPEEPWNQGQGQTHGFEVTDACSVLRLQRVAVENFERGIMMGYGDSLLVAECEFRSSRVGIATGSRFAAIDRSRFIEILDSGYGVLSYFQDRLVLSESLSTTNVYGSNKHIQVEGPSEVIVTDCRFLGANAGITLSRGPRAEIRRCEFIGQVNRGVSLATMSPSCALSVCLFRDQGTALVGSTFPGSKWFVDRVWFESVSHSTLRADFLQEGYFHDCHFAAGEHGVVSNSSYPLVKDGGDPDELTHFDMRSNWWGTTNPDSITALIYDNNDDGRVNYNIDFEPFSDGPTAVDRRSLGGVKSLFR